MRRRTALGAGEKCHPHRLDSATMRLCVIKWDQLGTENTWHELSASSNLIGKGFAMATDKRRLPMWQKPDVLYLILPLVAHGGFSVTRERRYPDQAAYIPEPTRCRDCLHWHPQQERRCTMLVPAMPKDGSGYCSYGEPKKGE